MLPQCFVNSSYFFCLALFAFFVSTTRIPVTVYFFRSITHVDKLDLRSGVQPHFCTFYWKITFFEHLCFEKLSRGWERFTISYQIKNNVVVLLLLLLLVPPPLGSRLKVTKTKQTVQYDLIRSTTERKSSSFICSYWSTRDSRSRNPRRVVVVSNFNIWILSKIIKYKSYGLPVL